MYFENIDNIPLFDSFLKEYKGEVDEIVNENGNNNTKIVIFGYPSKSIYAHAVISKDDFFKSLQRKPDPFIGYNEGNCKSVNLTIQEEYAMIAHEIGHVYDTNTYIEEDFLKKEIYADSMACKIGLRDFLVSGLEKIINSHCCGNMENQIQERIKCLNSEFNNLYQQ